MCVSVSNIDCVHYFFVIILFVWIMMCVDVCYMCVYCYHVIITFCYRLSKIQEKKRKVSDGPSIWLVK